MMLAAEDALLAGSGVGVQRGRVSSAASGAWRSGCRVVTPAFTILINLGSIAANVSLIATDLFVCLACCYTGVLYLPAEGASQCTSRSTDKQVYGNQENIGAVQLKLTRIVNAPNIPCLQHQQVFERACIHATKCVWLRHLAGTDANIHTQHQDCQ